MLSAFRRWRRARILARGAINESLWEDAISRYSFMRVLSAEEASRLRELVVLFLDEKSIAGAAGVQVDDEMRVVIAAQACMLILNLDLDWYRGWTEMIVYPDQFVVDYEYTDEIGVSHRVREPLGGESWLAGPVILSWADAEQADSGLGYNVVIHEFAHKIDMLNGEANGFPPLHAGMSRERWARTWSRAYEDFCERVDRRRETAIDPYAAESPAEFFAVLSESFFEIPVAVGSAHPELYAELAEFYRQDPAERLKLAAAER